MNAAQLRERIKAVAAYAIEQEPVDVDARARTFIAGLSGRIEHGEPELAAIIWELLARPNDDRVVPLASASAG